LKKYSLIISVAFLLLLVTLKAAASSISLKEVPETDTSFNISFPGNAVICPGGSLTLSVASNMNFPYGISYQWMNNNAPISGATNSSYTTTVAGVFSVDIKRTNVEDTILQAVTVTNVQNPIVSIAYSPSTPVCEGVPVGFSAKSTNTLSGYLWSFGDNTSSNLANPLHAYNGNYGNGTDNYPISLTVTDNNGCTGAAPGITIAISQKPQANISGSTLVCTGASQSNFSFHNASSTTNTNTDYRFIWGDGTPDTDLPTFNSAQTHQYNIGNNTFLLIVTGNNGCKDTLTQTVYLGSNPSAGIASPGNTNICNNSTLVFPISSVSNNSPGTTYTILFNDGSPSLAFNQSTIPTSISHTFTNSSCGVLSLGISNSFMAQIQATNPCAPTQGSVTPIYVSQSATANFKTQDTACVNIPVTFTNTTQSFTAISRSGVCSNGVKVWTITPGTGFTLASGQTLGNTNNNDPNPENWTTSNTDNLKVTFTIPGTYTIRLSVGGNSTCTPNFIEKTICVNPVPVAAFSIDKLSGCLPLNVITTNSTTAPNCGNDTYQWSVAYTNSSACTPNTGAYSISSGSLTSTAPQFQFSNPGTYTIGLIAIAPAKACQSSITTNTVTIKSVPKISISIPLAICQNLSITPTATADDCFGTQNPPAYQWTFNGANTSSSNAAAPGPIQMITAGQQNISLAATNECGTITVNKTITVNPTPVILSTATNNPTTCQGSNGNIVLNGLTPNTNYSVSYLKNNNSSSVTLTADANGLITISGLIAGSYSNITAKLGNCVSNPVGPFTLTDPPLPATPTISIISPVCSGNSVTLNAASSSAGVSYSWTGPANFTSTQQNPVIPNITASASGNYTVTVKLNNCAASATTAVTVNATPVLPAVTNLPYCINATATPLTATPSSGNTLNWYTAATGGTTSATAPTPATTTTGNTNYFVSQTSPAGCESQRATITVTVNPIPAAPVTNDIAYCQFNTASPLTATALAGNKLKWYSAPTGGSPVSTPTPSTTATGTTTYYVSQSAIGCESPRAAITVTINPQPAPPAVSNIAFCQNIAAQPLTAIADAGNTLKWYTVSSGGTASLVAPTPLTTNAGTINYYVSQVTSSGCESQRATLTVTINPQPAPPTVTNPSYCLNATATALTATPASGNTLNWYTTATGGTASATAPIPATTTTGITNYFVSQTTLAGCESQLATLTVTVNPIPSAPVTNDITYCQFNTASLLTATALAGNTLKWYSAATGGSTIATPTPATTTTGTTTYYVSQSAIGCESPRAALNVTINPQPAPPAVSNIAFCQNTTAQPLTATADAGNTLKWYPTSSGGVSSTLAPTPITTTSATINYYVSQVSATGCESQRATLTVTINPQPAPPAVTNISYCLNATASSLTASPASGNTINWYSTATGGIASVSAPTPTTINTGITNYFVSQTSPAGCESQRATLTVTVNPIPAAPVINDIAYCQFNTASPLTATAIAGNSLKWYSAATGGSPIATPTPATTATGTTTYYVSQSAIGCESPRAALNVTINPQPAPPAVSNIAFCQNTVAQPLTAIADAGNTLKWYNALTGGSASAIAPTPITTTAGTINYYVSQVSATGCESQRATLTVTINPQPTTPAVSNLSYCLNATATPLTATPAAGNTINWYTTATGGTASATAPTPVTTTTGNTNYFVSQTTPAGCESQRATITVTVNPIPTVNNQSNQVFCNGSASGTINFSGSLTGTVYNWTNSNPSIGLPATGSGNLNFTAINTTAQPVSGTVVATPFLNGCFGTSTSFTITVNPSPQLSSLITTTAICNNTVLNYSASSSTPNAKYAWNRLTVTGISNPASASTDSSGTISETLINTTVNPIQVTYQYTISANGCNNHQVVTVTINPDAKANYTYTIQNLCAPGLLNSSNIIAVAYPKANGSYLWYVNNNKTGNSIQFPGYTINNPNDSIRIKLVTASLYGCKSDSVTYSFYTVPKPVPSFTKSAVKGCGPLTVNFRNTTAPLPLNQYNYKWQFGNGDSSFLTAPPSIIYNPAPNHQDTTYYISLTASNQCNTITTLKDSVLIRPLPVALFQPDTTVGCSINTSPFLFSVNNISKGSPNTYYWDFGDNTKDTLLTNTSVNHVYTVAQLTDFTIKLTAINECGSDQDSLKIVVYPRNIFAKLYVDGPVTWSCAPDTITFKNVSSGANKYVINFGDNSPDSIYTSPLSVENIKHFYKAPGTYIVTMVASNGCSNEDTTISLNIYLFQKPAAAFKTSSTQFCQLDTIHFQNLSEAGLIYSWDFGDGIISTDFNPIHFYSKAGTYTVTLVVSSLNSPGKVCTDTIRKLITVGAKPVSNFTSNTTASNCDPFFFTGTTNQPHGNIINWHFTDPFSSDTTMSGNTGTHLFENTGNYTIRMIVFNSVGCSDTAAISVKIIPSPVAAFTVSDSVKCYFGDTIYCTNTSTYAGKDVVNYYWYIDGVLQSTSTHFKHKFSAPASIKNPVYFKIMLVAVTSYGCSDSAYQTITLMPQSSAGFNFFPDQGCSPLTVSFSNTSQYANSYKWYLNNQLFSTLILPDPIVLSNPGSVYTVKLVTDQLLGCGKDSTFKTISTYPKPSCIFTSFNNTLPCTGNLNVVFTDLSTVLNGNIISWFWDFGDGQTSTLQNPVHLYAIPGSYTVSHYVIDDKNCFSDTIHSILKNFGAPVVNFTLNSVCMGTPVTPMITEFNPGYGSTTIKKYKWDFGDGTIDTSAAPVHNYKKEGLYTVLLTVVSDSSCIADTNRQTIKVYGTPIADFSFENSCINTPVIFTDKSIAGYGQTSIDRYRWNFGDGSVLSSLTNPTHIYTLPEKFTVSLKISSTLCPSLADSVSKIISIVEPRSSQIYPLINASRGIPVQLSALNGGVNYNWDPATGLNQSDIQKPIGNYTITDPSKILYTISILDSNGCTIKDQQEVWIFSEPDVYAPTAFTPNGDGVNDLFLPVYVNISKLEYLRIFDRWGKLIFETNDMGKAWDGTYNGKPLPMDTFVFVIIGIDTKGNSILRKGNVTLIRD